MVSGGSIQIILPYLYNFGTQNEAMLSQNEPSFCQINLNQNISCLLQKDTLGTQLTIQINQSLFKNTLYTLIIGNIKNPYQTSPFVSTPRVIVNSYFTTQTKRVNALEFGNLSFYNTIPYFSNYRINITLPPELQFNPVATNPILSPNIIDITNVVINGNNIHFPQPLFGQAVIDNGQLFQVYLFQVSNSNSTKTTRPFKIIVYEQIGYNQYIVEQTLAELTFQAVPSTMSIPSISAINAIINQTTQLDINMTFNQKYNQSAFVKIIVPNEMTVFDSPESNCIQIAGPLLSASATCQGIANDTILVKNIFNTIINSTKTWIKITTPSLSTPLSTKKTLTSFKFYTYYDSNQFQVETLTNNLFFNAQPGKIFQQNVQIQIQNSIVGAISDYIMSFKISNSIPIGGYFNIKLPNDIGIFNPSITNGSLSTVSDNLSPNLQILLQAQLNLISVTNSIQNSINSDSLIKIGLKQLNNPISMKPTDSFTIQTFDKYSQLIDQISSGLFVSVSSPSDFVSVNIQPINNTNGIKTDFKLNIIFKVQHLSGSIVNIIIPLEIANLESIACYFNEKLLQNQISCTKFQQNSNTLISLKLINDYKPYDTLTIIYGPQRNPVSIKPISSFQVMTLNGIYLIEQKLDNIFLASLPSTIQNFTVTPAVRLVLYEKFTLNIKFTSVNTLSSTSYIILTLPQELQIVDYTCGATQGILITSINCEKFNNNSQKIKISLINQNEGSFLDQSQIEFQLYNIIIQSLIQNTSGFSIETFTYDNYYIDILQNGAFLEIPCILPCRTCFNTSNNCTSCFDEKLSQFYLLDIFIQPQICQKSCRSGYFSLGNQCQQCNSSCNSCANTPSNCTSCKDSHFQLNNSCFQQCPPQYYSNQINLLCKKCSLPCLECNGTGTNCTKCQNNYLYLNQCINICPSNFYQNQFTQQCEKCNSPCFECSIIGSNCTKCETGYLHQNQCIENCPNGYLKNQNKLQCEKCIFPCQECEITALNCTKCQFNYLYDNQCIPICPIGFYQNNSTQQCTKCIDYCNECTSQTQCQSCNQNQSLKYLYNQNCLEGCPSKTYIDINQTCQNCDTSCKTCEGFFNNCTSCNLASNLKYNFQGKCINQCPQNTIEYNKNCITCNIPCKLCQEQDSNFCYSCISGFYLYNNKCVQQCPDGYYNDNILYQCTPCQTPCQTCLNKIQCTSCISDLNNSLRYLYNYSCVSQCPKDISIQSGIQCEICQDSCRTCEDNVFNCKTCQEGYIFNPERFNCLKECQSGYFSEKGICVGCNSVCKSCQNNSQTCTSCVEGSDLPYLLNNRCLQSCPKNYYEIKELGQCQKCTAPCIDCNDQSFCNKCDPQSDYKYLYQGSCTNSCDNTMYITDELQCVKCALGCSACDISQTNCLACHNEYYLYQNECVRQCPESLSPNDQLNQCVTKINQSFIPFPFLITAFVFICAIGFGKWHRPDTWITGNILAAISIPEVAARIYYLISIYVEQIQGSLKNNQNNSQNNGRLLTQQQYITNHENLFNILLKLMIFSLITHYFINFFILAHHIIKLQKNDLTQKWRQKQFRNRLTEYIILGLTGIVSSKCLRFLYSNFIGFEFFNIKIFNFQQFFSVINRLSLINLFISAMPTFTATILGIYTFQNISTFFLFQCIECLILTLIVEILTIIDAQRRKKESILKKIHSEIQSNEFIKSDQSSILNQTKKHLIKDKDDSQIVDYDPNNILDHIYKEQDQVFLQSDSKLQTPHHQEDSLFEVDNLKTRDKLISLQSNQSKNRSLPQHLQQKQQDLYTSEEQLQYHQYQDQKVGKYIEIKAFKTNLENSKLDNNQNQEKISSSQARRAQKFDQFKSQDQILECVDELNEDPSENQMNNIQNTQENYVDDTNQFYNHIDNNNMPIQQNEFLNIQQSLLKNTLSQPEENQKINNQVWLDTKENQQDNKINNQKELNLLGEQDYININQNTIQNSMENEVKINVRDQLDINQNDLKYVDNEEDIKLNLNQAKIEERQQNLSNKNSTEILREYQEENCAEEQQKFRNEIQDNQSQNSHAVHYKQDNVLSSQKSSKKFFNKKITKNINFNKEQLDEKYNKQLQKQLIEENLEKELYDPSSKIQMQDNQTILIPFQKRLLNSNQINDQFQGDNPNQNLEIYQNESSEFLLQKQGSLFKLQELDINNLSVSSAEEIDIQQLEAYLSNDDSNSNISQQGVKNYIVNTEFKNKLQTIEELNTNKHYEENLSQLINEQSQIFQNKQNTENQHSYQSQNKIENIKQNKINNSSSDTRQDIIDNTLLVDNQIVIEEQQNSINSSLLMKEVNKYFSNDLEQIKNNDRNVEKQQENLKEEDDEKEINRNIGQIDENEEYDNIDALNQYLQPSSSNTQLTNSKNHFQPLFQQLDESSNIYNNDRISINKNQQEFQNKQSNPLFVDNQLIQNDENMINQESLEESANKLDYSEVQSQSKLLQKNSNDGNESEEFHSLEKMKENYDSQEFQKLNSDLNTDFLKGRGRKRLKDINQTKNQIHSGSTDIKQNYDSNNLHSFSNYTKKIRNLNSFENTTEKFKQNKWNNQNSQKGSSTTKAKKQLSKAVRPVSNSIDKRLQDKSYFNLIGSVNQYEDNKIFLSKDFNNYRMAENILGGQIPNSQENKVNKLNKQKPYETGYEDKSLMSPLNNSTQSIKSFVTFRQSFATDLNPYKQKQPIDLVLENYLDRNNSAHKSNLITNSKTKQTSNKQKISILKNTYK